MKKKMRIGQEYLFLYKHLFKLLEIECMKEVFSSCGDNIEQFSEEYSIPLETDIEESSNERPKPRLLRPAINYIIKEIKLSENYADLEIEEKLKLGKKMLANIYNIQRMLEEEKLI